MVKYNCKYKWCYESNGAMSVVLKIIISQSLIEAMHRNGAAFIFLIKNISFYKWCYKYNGTLCVTLIIIISEFIKESVNEIVATFVFSNKKYPSL